MIGMTAAAQPAALKSGVNTVWAQYDANMDALATGGAAGAPTVDAWGNRVEFSTEGGLAVSVTAANAAWLLLPTMVRCRHRTAGLIGFRKPPGARIRIRDAAGEIVRAVEAKLDSVRGTRVYGVDDDVLWSALSPGESVYPTLEFALDPPRSGHVQFVSLTYSVNLAPQAA